VYSANGAPTVLGERIDSSVKTVTSPMANA
jgi:hypothetical protein